MRRASFLRLHRAARVAAAAVATALPIVGASCRDAVTDDVVDVKAVLCEGFDTCGTEAGACEHLGEFFDAGRDGTVYDAYFDWYLEWGCGEGCGPLAVCLDFESLCSAKTEACGRDFECCDASSGAAFCRDGGCCYDLGVPCETDDDCCALADEEHTPVKCFERVGADVATCGGAQACGLLGDECDDDLKRCCGTSECSGNVCVPRTCVVQGEPCQGPGDCCEGTCEGGRCQPPDQCEANADLLGCCVAKNEPCDPAPGAKACCEGGVCTILANGLYGCGDAEEKCIPKKAVCGLDERPCCTNGPTDEIHCLGTGDGEGKICQPIGCQLDEGEPCNDGLPCCSGLTCQPDRRANAAPDATVCLEECRNPTCHDVRQIGGPLRRLSTNPCEPGDPDPSCSCAPEPSGDHEACVEAVCAEDSYCCCEMWSDICVQNAAKLEVCTFP